MAPVPPVARSAASVRSAVGQVGELSDVLRGLPQEQPLVALGIALVAVLLLFLVVAFLLRRRQGPGARFRRFLANEDAVTVLTHPNPDPDALACAFATANLAESVDTDATIAYPGQIRHQENRAFRTVLDLDCTAIDTAADLPEQPIVLVDHGEPRGFPDAESVPVDAVIDHHPDGGSGKRFTDVRPEYGACATIFAEYFEELDVPIPDPESSSNTGPLSTPLATGLLFGILTDTGHLTNGCSEAEFDAARYLYPGVNEDTLDRVSNPQVDAEVLDVKSRAIADRDVRAPFAVSDVGEVSNADAIPQAADELVRLEGVSAVVVVGHREGICQLSGRSRDDRVHMGDTLRAAVEELPGGNAGGHARMGGGRVQLDGTAREELVERLFEAMNGER